MNFEKYFVLVLNIETTPIIKSDITNKKGKSKKIAIEDPKAKIRKRNERYISKFPCLLKIYSSL